MRRLPKCRDAVLVTLSLGVAFHAGAAQRRPRLDKGADTNDAQAYYNLGVKLIGRDYPDDAAIAFQWATRLDPKHAGAVYGEYVALLVRDKPRLLFYLRRDPSVLTDPELGRADSLRLRALALDPFIDRNLEAAMWLLLNRAQLYGKVRLQNDGSRCMFCGLMGGLRGKTDTAEIRPLLDHANGYTTTAIQHYSKVLRHSTPGTPRHVRLLVERGRMHGYARHDTAALVDFTSARQWIHTDTTLVARMPMPVALIDYSIGVLYERLRVPDSAAAAYTRAAVDDSTFSDARMRLALLAYHSGDTARALAQMSDAVRLGAGVGDPFAHAVYGALLATAMRAADAEREFRRAIELAPDYATPYLQLGQLLESLGEDADAIIQYQAFVARAPRNDSRRALLQQRLVSARPPK